MILLIWQVKYIWGGYLWGEGVIRGGGVVEYHFCFLDFGYVCVGIGGVGRAYHKHCGW